MSCQRMKTVNRCLGKVCCVHCLLPNDNMAHTTVFVLVMIKLVEVNHRQSGDKFKCMYKMCATCVIPHWFFCQSLPENINYS